jgi:hypothetical protein
VSVDLIFVIPNDANNIQLDWVGSALYTPPQAPIAASLPLFAGGLALLGWLARRSDWRVDLSLRSPESRVWSAVSDQP